MNNFDRLLNELAADTFYVAMMYGKKLIGYYVSDDDDVTKDKKKAKAFRKKDAAEKVAEASNKQWNLKGDMKFEVQ